MSTNLRAICTACRIGGATVLATHGSRYGDGHAWCDQHARVGDPPLGEVNATDAVDAVRGQVWPGLGEPQGNER